MAVVEQKTSVLAQDRAQIRGCGFDVIGGKRKKHMAVGVYSSSRIKMNSVLFLVFCEEGFEQWRKTVRYFIYIYQI